MQNKQKLSKRVLSFIMALILTLNIVLISGIIPVSVWATDAAPLAFNELVYFVDGKAKTNQDGKSVDTAFATIKQASDAISALTDVDASKKAIIVICGPVDATVDGFTISGSGDGNSFSSSQRAFVNHPGGVEITSVHKGVDYRATKGAKLTMPKNFMLLCNTTFTNIKIDSGANEVYANYYSLELGEGVEGTFAKNIFLGTNAQTYYAAYYGDLKRTFDAQDVTFTMKSGTIGTLDCCFGTDNQGYTNGAGKSYSVTLDIQGGTVGALKATYNEANSNPKVNNVNVIISAGTPEINLTEVMNSARIIGKKTVEYRDVVGVKSVKTGFDVLKLTNSTITTTLDVTTRSVVITDDSRLILTAAPLAEVSVTLTRSGETWGIGNTIITAPAGVAEKMFVLTNENAAWAYTSESKANWKLGDVAVVPRPEGNIFYVDGVGSGKMDGSSKNNAFKTMVDAYNAIPAGSTNTTIVICGKVDPRVDTKWAGSTEQYFNNGFYDHWWLPKNSGKVTITSVCGEENYLDSAGLMLAGFWYLLSDTTLENINILRTGTRITADYYDFHLGEGVVGKTVANAVYLGTWVTVNGTMVNKYPFKVKDIEFTMESGTIGTLFGGGEGTQATDDSLGIGMNNKITLNIKGGKVTTLYGSGQSGKTYHAAVDVNLLGGTVDNVYGVANGAIVYGDVTVTLGGTTVKSVLPKENDTVQISGNPIINYKDVQNAVLTPMQGFTTLKLTNSTVTVPAGMEDLWSSITKIQMTDDSVLTLKTIPTVPANKVEVSMIKSGTAWNTSTAVIKAPAGTADIFSILFPLDHAFTYNQNAASWTMKHIGINIGNPGTAGQKLQVSLGLPEDGAYTPLAPNATIYESFLQKLEDLGEAKDEVNVISPIEVQGEIELYVDGDRGNDSNSGGIDAPFKTISRALAYVEALQKMDIKGVVVYLREGTYFTTESIVLNEKHSGKNGVPLIISAYKGEKVTITSSIDFSGKNFAPVTDEEIRDRLRDAVKDVIVQVDLKAMGVTELGSIIGGNTGGPNYQIYVNGAEYIPARYPNATNLTVGEVLDKGPCIGGEWMGTNLDSTGVEFKMQDVRPTLWKNDGNIWLKGSMYAEWDIKNIRVMEIRRESIKLDGGAEYGARSLPSNTYYYYNILEELDVPGEYYVDLNTGILYLYPVENMDKAIITYSGNTNDLILLKNTENVVINGLTLDGGAGNGIHMSICTQTIIQNCTITRVGTGVYMNNCKKSGVIYSDISEIANRPIEVISPIKFFDYTPELNFIQNCYIHSTGTANPKFCGIYVRGTGQVISHNLLQGGFSVSIYLQYFKECIVEYNEIVGSPTGTYDGGAIYIPSEGEGLHVRYNYIHDIGKFSKKNDPWGIYFDEGLSHCYAYGNIMMNVPGGYFSNGGSNNVIMNNVVLNVEDRTGVKYAYYGSNNLDVYTVDQKSRGRELQRYNEYLELSPEEQKAFRERYPLIYKLFERIEAALKTETGVNTRGVYYAHGSYVANNLTYNHGTINQFKGEDIVYKNNRQLRTNDFVDPLGHNFNLKDSVDTSRWGFAYTTPSMDRMGVLTDKKEKIGNFEGVLPVDNFHRANSHELLLRWSIADGADTYKLEIATNAEMTENLREITLESTKMWLIEDEYFTYESTYYWRVTAYSTAESRQVTPVTTEVMSFTTMSKNDYLEFNKPDTTILQSTIMDAEALAQMIEENADGLFESETAGILRNAIEVAIAAKNNAALTQREINAANLALQDAILVAKSSRKVSKVTFENIDTTEWSDPLAGVIQFEENNGELKMVVDDKERSEAIYAYELGLREILCFKYKIDTKENWQGFALAQTNPGAFITSGTDGYLIVINPAQIELQKYRGGKKLLQIDVKVPQNLFVGGEYYDIEIGAINNKDGSVGIHFKINDTLIFDPTIFVDTVDDLVIGNTGQKLFEDPIVNCGNFGVVVNPVNGAAYFKQADEDVLGVTDYTDPVPGGDTGEEPGEEPSEEPGEEPTTDAPADGEEEGGFFAAIAAFFAAIIAFFKELFGIK